MGYDKFGLNWSVWGDTPKQTEKNQCDLADAIGKDWSSEPVNEQIVTEDEPEPVAKKKTEYCTLKNPRFITDASTDFNKPCKVTVDVDGELSGKVHFALWARYKGTEYNLEQEKSADVQNGSAQTEIELFYLDEHYTDKYQNGESEATVDYFFKVTARGCNQSIGEALTMPCDGAAITVKPKISSEYPLIILDRKLSTYLDPSETKISSPAVFIELFLEQSSTAQLYDKGAVVTVNGPGTFDCFEDQECTKTIDLTLPISSDKVSGEKKLKLWLKGTRAGKCRISLKPKEIVAPFVAGDTASVELAVIELKLSICKQDTAAIRNIQIDPDQEPDTHYYKALRNLKIPEQIEMSDQEKVATGRIVHVQKENNFSRAKLILKKIDGSELPAGTDNFGIVLSQTNSSGGVELYSKEWDNASAVFPVKVKLQDLGRSDQIFWVQGKTVTKKVHDVVIDCGLSNGGSSKEIKRNADWVRLTVVEIKEVKVDYTAVAGQAAAWNAAKSYFFINTKIDPDGRKIIAGAQLSEPMKDVTIHFMLAPHRDNRKKANWGVDLPSKWKWKDITPFLKHRDKVNRKDLMHFSEKTDASGYAKKELILSRFGGDKFYLCAYIDQDPHCAKFIDGDSELKKKKPVMAAQPITVRRKFWYQMTKAKGYNPPLPNDAVKAYERVHTEMVLDQTVEFEEATVPAGTFYPEYVVKGGASNSKVAVISDCNKNAIANSFFKFKADQPVKNHLIVCDLQYDARKRGKLNYAKGTSNPIKMALAAGSSVKFFLDGPVFNPTLHGPGMIVDLYWFSVSNPAITNQIPHANAKIPNPRTDNTEIEIITPALTGSPADPIYIYVYCVSPWGPYLGESFGKHSLIVYDNHDIVDYNDTVIHEIGHAFNQTPRPNTQPDPTHIPSHPDQADRGQGNHCQVHDIIGRPICVMYDSGPLHNRTALHRFCDDCHPYLLIEDLYRP